jgi:hypothetical protein
VARRQLGVIVSQPGEDHDGTPAFLPPHPQLPRRRLGAESPKRPHRDRECRVSGAPDPLWAQRIGWSTAVSVLQSRRRAGSKSVPEPSVALRNAGWRFGVGGSSVRRPATHVYAWLNEWGPFAEALVASERVWSDDHRRRLAAGPEKPLILPSNTAMQTLSAAAALVAAHANTCAPLPMIRDDLAGRWLAAGRERTYPKARLSTSRAHPI